MVKTEMEKYAIRCAEWLISRVREAETKDPQLRLLKDKINQLSEELSSAHEDAIPELLRKQNQAIEELLHRALHPPVR